MPRAALTTETTQSDIIDALSNGAAYGDAAAEVRRIDTHCSVIFLVKNRAFKLKKAVKFSYLDYTSVAARENFTRAELRLNRRTAPQLYLGIRKVVADDDGRPRLAATDDPAPAIDWILEMRRFGDDALLATLADEDRLTPALMQDLADAIHHFHDGAEPTPSYGTVEIARSVLTDCIDNLRLESPPLDTAIVKKFTGIAKASLDKLAPLLDGRRGRGLVRRCHGDLHLGNICVYEDRPVLFDGIEFSDAISCIDVFYDLAFLLMDLCHRDRADLANIVLNRYIDRCGDGEGLAALPYFMSLRAAIRAHILAGASKHQDDQAIADKKRDESIAYLATAAHLLDIKAPPRLVAIGGLSGSGKSTLARALAPAFRPAPGARIIRSDTLRKRLLKVAPETRLLPAAYGLETTKLVYATMQEEAATGLQAGYSVIVDATYLREIERRDIEAQAARLQVDFAGFWLDVPKEILAARIEARHNDASDATRAILEQQFSYDLGAVAWRRIDAGQGMERTLATLRSALSLPQ